MPCQQDNLEVAEYINSFKSEPDVIELANKVNSGSAEAFKKDKALCRLQVSTIFLTF